MSEHVTQWLSAYQDGELRGGRLQQVEAHLAKCEACQAELDSLYDLSVLLHQTPLPEFTSPERLAAQVNLRLPRKPVETTANKVLEIGWWMIPVSLVSMWVLIIAVGWVGNVFITANGLGLVDTSSLGSVQLGSVQVDILPDWIAPDSSPAMSGTLARLGLLNEDNLTWVTSLERFARNILPQFVWQVSIAFLYIGWLVIWWTRHTRQENGQLPASAVLQSK